jgi:UDP-N-acetylglucosamine 2-epimerase (non-hydrolysing)/UDP-GlcNAc3NAcA epimerase
VKILTVIGNRPQFIKAAAVSPRLRDAHHEHLVHTGQHFDDRLSEVFFSELGLPAPDEQLGVALGSATSQTGRMLGALGPVLERVGADLVLVYGDTNSTLAGALAGAQAGVPVAHVEAGMRSFDPTMPEELNRVLVDHAGALLLCSSEAAVENLRRESVSGRVELVGDVMVDVAAAVQPRARERADLVLSRGLEPREYLLATAHRAGNVDDPSRLRALVEVLAAMPLPVLLPLHPRTEARLESSGLIDEVRRLDGVHIEPPLGYFELTALLCQARGVLTDSGGLQKEAYLAAVPCVTLRANTEWTETVQTGWNVLVDLDAVAAREAVLREPPEAHPDLYGDGRAGERVAAAIAEFGARLGGGRVSSEYTGPP